MLQARRTLGVLAVFGALFLAANASAYDHDEPHAFHHAKPGDVDYYVLVLAWSPTYCPSEGDDRGDADCNGNGADEFVLHGWWPQYEIGWPEDCYQGQRPWGAVRRH
jgi:ribonuclease T2